MMLEYFLGPFWVWLFIGETPTVLSLIGCLALSAGCQAVAQKPQRPPNIVFILADDLGWRDLGCYGSEYYRTPHLDRLASEGMRFTQAYAACPVCSPTRASIMTGRHPVRTGITDYINPAGRNQPDQWKKPTKMMPASYADRLALDEVTIAERLKESGYATFFAGKWHLGVEGWWPTDQGFDVNKGGTQQGGPYGGDKYFSPYGNPNLEDGPPGEHLPDRLARETVAFMESKRDQPFFAMLSFYSVHTPLMARDDLKSKYSERDIGREERFGRERSNRVRLVQDHPTYAAMVEAMDLAVGTVLDGLEALGLEEHTAVFFMSDNGGLSTSEGMPTSNVPLRAGKGWLYEGGIREPMIVKWPGVTRPGSACDTPVISSDFFPTILDIAGLPLAPEVHADGKSFASLLRGGSPDGERALHWHYPHYSNQGGMPGAAIRKGDFKLIRFYEDNTVELYNIADDLGETEDLSGKKRRKTMSLLVELDTWLADTGAKFPSERPE